MDHPKAVGDRTTLAVMLALQQRGYTLLLPFGENVRYDLVIDDGERLSRVQCKTGRLRNGAVRFKACSSYAHHPSPRMLRRDYGGQIDCFGVHCPDNGSVYLIPFAAAPLRTQGSLRVEPTANNQVVGIRYAKEYEIANFGPCLPSSGPLASSGGPGSCA